jgi:hypothetical protein
MIECIEGGYWEGRLQTVQRVQCTSLLELEVVLEMAHDVRWLHESRWCILAFVQKAESLLV